MPERANFTKDYLTKLQPTTKRITVHDEKTAGLILRVEPSGTKTFCWLRKGDGRIRFKKIGPFPDLTVENARMKASEHNSSLGRWAADDFVGPSPFERKHEVLTLGVVLDDYIDRHLKANAKNPDRAAKSARWQFDTYLSDWKTRRLDSITRKDVLDLYGRTKKKGVFTANRTIQLLRALMNWALNEMAWKGENTARIKLISEKPFQRDRFLSKEEAVRLFAALNEEPSQNLQHFVILALFTGARMSDVLSMRWQDISFENHSWTIPNPKSSIPYIVPLLPEVVNILRDREFKNDDSTWVFPGSGKTKHVVGFKQSWPALLKRAKLTEFRIHDLRRTLGSWMANKGESLPVIGKALGHSTAVAATSIYARLQTDTVRDAMQRATKGMLKD